MTDKGMCDWMRAGGTQESLSTPERAAIVETMALAIARHRMGDPEAPADMVERADRALALQLARLSAPLHPLPRQPEFEN